VIGSDAGRIVIAEFNVERNLFVKVHEETFGRTGVRRIVPGQYVAVDPKGRAVMIAAIEKQKFVYQLNRDNAARLTISSPLEAHKAHTVLFDLIALDVAFEHPIFASLEIDYQKADTDATGEAVKNTEKVRTVTTISGTVNGTINGAISGIISRTNPTINGTISRTYPTISNTYPMTIPFYQ